MKKIPLSFLFACTMYFVYAQYPAAPISASVQLMNNRPVIMINGKPQYPLMYALTDVPGGRWSWEELPKYNMQQFYKNGFKLIQVDLFFDHVWMQDGSINIDTAQMQLKGVLNACPGAAIFLRFHVNAPKWWQRLHPHENTLYADTTAKPDIDFGLQRIIEDDEETPLRTSLASVKWQQQAGEKLKIFLQKLQTIPEAKSIAGIQVAGGVYGEWHQWGFIENEPDISEPMLIYFRQWLQKKYTSDKELQQAWNDAAVNFITVSFPTLAERRTTTAGIFRNPVYEQKTIDYYEALNTCVADDILFFCQLIKDHWPRPIITGAFYGYFYSVFGREAASGHLAVEKLLNSPAIDFLSAPAAYYPEAAETGEAYRSRGLINSALLHKKLWLDEMDQQTPLLPLKDTAFKTSLAKSIATVRRNMMYSFTHGTGFWFYDFGPSGFNGGKRLNDHGSYGWWDEPSLMKEIKKLKDLFEKSLTTPFESDADILLVHDTKSFYYTGSSKDKSYMAHWANNWIPPAIFKTGAIHDVINIADLDKVNINQYKLVVFVNTWVLNDAQKKLIKDKIAASKRSMVWIYAPGYSNEKSLGKNFVEEVTQIKMQELTLSDAVTIEMDSAITPNKKFSVWNNTVNPLFVANDDKVAVLGTINGTSNAGFVKKQLKNHTSWFTSLPPADIALWKYIFKQSGVHIYDDGQDVLYGGNGVLSVHTAQGGQRTIYLKNGKNIEVNLPQNSTIVLNALTGEIIFE